GSIVSSVDSDRIGKMIEDQSISGGMIPKIEYALDALENDVGKVHIINGGKQHALLLELFTDKGVGTEVIL
ncbi:MAG: acetylglutamate kinase, partial [Desulfobacterales bacterium]